MLIMRLAQSYTQQGALTCTGLGEPGPQARQVPCGRPLCQDKMWPGWLWYHILDAGPRRDGFSTHLSSSARPPSLPPPSFCSSAPALAILCS
jgi:hypothetical protein